MTGCRTGAVWKGHVFSNRYLYKLVGNNFEQLEHMYPQIPKGNIISTGENFQNGIAVLRDDLYMVELSKFVVKTSLAPPYHEQVLYDEKRLKTYVCSRTKLFA